jgi:hypothetical protein
VEAGRALLWIEVRKGNLLFAVEGLEGRRARDLHQAFSEHELHLVKPARLLAILLLPLALAACFGSDESGPTSFMEDSSAPQPFPENYRTELLAFMKTYLNNPVGVRNAMMADPVQRTVGGRVRFVSCLRFSEPQSDGTYREPRERAVLFINGRLDRVLPNAAEVCAGANYAPFPEMERMSR